MLMVVGVSRRKNYEFLIVPLKIRHRGMQYEVGKVQSVVVKVQKCRIHNHRRTVKASVSVASGCERLEKAFSVPDRKWVQN